MVSRCFHVFMHGVCLLLFASACGRACSATRQLGGDAGRGRETIGRYGCIACHDIPGIPNPDSDIAPPLKGIATRSYIAGVLPNTRDNMIRWLRHPQQVDPRTAMPDMEVTDRDARDIAAYLYTLD